MVLVVVIVVNVVERGKWLKNSFTKHPSKFSPFLEVPFFGTCKCARLAKESDEKKEERR